MDAAMNVKLSEQQSVAEQAAKWLDDLESADQQIRLEFLDWLKASPLHVHELLLAGRVQEALYKIDPERHFDVEQLIEQARIGANVRTLTGRAIAPEVRKGRVWRMPRSIAAAASLALVGLAILLAHLYLDRGNLYDTQRGEQRLVKLQDGSVVLLNTHTRVRVRYGENTRDIYLKNGQALFQVQRDAGRPFRVFAGQAVIQAIGTQFDVRVDNDRAMVAVVEGSVRVTLPTKHDEADRAQLAAGEALTVNSAGLIKPVQRPDVRALTAWRQQRLIFHDTPLAEIASEFNRYNNAPRLRIEGPELGDRRFDGSFDALRPESFLRYLSQKQGVAFDRRGEEVVIFAIPAETVETPD